MKISNLDVPSSRITVALGMMFLLLFFGLPLASGAPAATPLSPQETLRLGQRMYRQGILPAGEPMQAHVKGNPTVPGTTFACASCHLRSGLGSLEGGIFTPPVNGSQLFQPYVSRSKNRGVLQNPLYAPAVRKRTAYGANSLTKAISSGVDPNGNTLSDAMPRYVLKDEDMAILISYLKSLSMQFSPGASTADLHFATVITDDVKQEDLDAMLVPLLNMINSRSKQGRLLQQMAKNRTPASVDVMMPWLSRSLSLSLWTLKGPPETWRSQLEEYNRKKPAFALLGGMVSGEWEPIHRFSEENEIPCLFPNTDFPVISGSDWYTLYLSKGYYQEGETAARFLNAMGEKLKGRPIVQIVRDSREGRALSRGFLETWRELGHAAPTTVVVKPGEEITGTVLQQLSPKERPAAVMLWDGSGVPRELETLTSGGNGPEMVFVSSSYAGKSLLTLKEQLRDLTYITYPYRMPPGDEHTATDPSSRQKIFPADTSKAANQAYAITEILTMVFMEMKDNYYRDNFFDVIGMSDSLEVPLFERLTFSPGQRYASKGCYIVQLGKGEKAELVKKSAWVID